MGCATSKLDDLPAVALCRDRRAFLDEAVRHRFAFSEAHAAYVHSLKAVGLSLDRFFNLDFDAAALNIPLHGKGGPHLPEPPGSPPVRIQHHLHSRSDSGSHLHFHSESEDDDGSGSVSFHHHDAISPDHQQHSYDGGGRGFTNISYMKKQTTPSVVYTQRHMSPETMHMAMGEPSSSSSSYYPYTNYANNLNYNLHNGYQNYSNYPLAVASSSKAPSPPRSSTWDLLNPFDTFENNYPAYTSNHDNSRAIREEEGIPDLEDEDDEVVKEVHGDHKLLVDTKTSCNYSKLLDDDDDAGRVANDAELQHVVCKKNAVKDEDTLKDRGNANEFKPRGGFKGDLEVVKEIQVQFELASDSGSDLANFLEVGKLPYKWKRRNSHHVSSKILHLPVATLQRWMTTKSSDNVDQDVGLRSKNLSSTLHKLYLWETKLYEEVKVEEKMRVLHERKSRKMKRMYERCSEAHKVEAAKTFIRSLSTKIKIAIQVVDKISVKINTLRDDELWPQLNEFIQGLTKMSKSMLECHRNQCQAIEEAKQLDAIAAFRKNFSDDAHLEATHQLEHDLVNWTLGFSHWVTAQKGFVRSLNNWLMKCLLYVPEDGITPFSPGGIGAPQVFVICHQWSQLLDGISEKEVVDSMCDFASNVLQLCDRDNKEEMRRGMLANKDERKIKSLPLTGPGHVVYPSETTKGGSLQGSLQHVLEAMGTFTANSLKVYEELLQRIEEEGPS